MPTTGFPGNSTSPAEPAPPATVWIAHVPGYRIGVLDGSRIVIEPEDYHASYLALDKQDLEGLLRRLAG